MDFKAKLLVKPGTVPKLYKAQSVPFAIKGAIEGVLDILEAAGIIKRVTQCLSCSYHSSTEERCWIICETKM